MTKTWEASAREHLRTLLTGVLEALTPQVFMRETARPDGGALIVSGERVTLRRPGGVVRLAAVGKAARGMAAQAAAWGPFKEALVVAPRSPGGPRDAAGLDGFELIESDHPTPSEASLRAGERLLDLAESTGPDDTLLLLVSGGGSALAEVPAVPLADLGAANDLLLKAGVPIEGVNAVRKHLSRLKGGQLAQACRGHVVGLYLSDVTRDDLATIASGPVAPDPTTFPDAVRVLQDAGIWEQVPETVRAHLEAGLAGKIPDTVKPGNPAFDRVGNFVLAGNASALRRASDLANGLGYNALALDEGLQGEAREAGEAIGMLAHDAKRGKLAVKPPCAILLGGETVVHVRGRGKGGRNQEVALAAVDGLSGMGCVLGVLGTDGVDGPTDAAGAVVDSYTLARARAEGLDPATHLEENDAYPFFDRLNDLIRTGPTGTNARDLAVLLVRDGDA